MGPDLPITLVWRRWDDGGGGGETTIAVVVVVVVMAVVVVATSERRTTDDARDTIVRVLESNPNRIESSVGPSAITSVLSAGVYIVPSSRAAGGPGDDPPGLTTEY
jgi:heme/copper-type cytochrome/quinol oxidase subunit 2